MPVVIWQHKLAQPFVRRALLVCVVQMLVLGMVGVLDEMRVYGEMIPMIYLALAVLVWQVDGVAKFAGAIQLWLTGAAGGIATELSLEAEPANAAGAQL